MNPTLLAVFEWYGAISAPVAATMVALNLGRRVTGWAFVLFVTSSIALIVYGFADPEQETAIGVQNIVLLMINLTGVYRYLIAKTAGG
ncbi:MAG: hypothetical protein H6704_23520 [Myxococcales bacterium]|nr:hypothetical protein [Myxococcales bacterium]